VLTAPAGAPVVVGVDGSEDSMNAVRLAIRLAVERNRPVRLVHAFVPPAMYLPLTPASVVPTPYGPAEEDLREEAERVVARAVAYARGVDPRVRVSGEVLTGGAAAVLVDESRQAAMVVVGGRGRGGFADLLLGSVAVQIAAHAAGPVVVARGAQRSDAPVVVGVDGSPISAQAIDFAAQEATLRQSILVAVHAWSGPLPTDPDDLLALTYDARQVQADESRVLAESLAGLADNYPDLRVQKRLVPGQAVGHILINQSRQAQLIVVGSRGHGGFAGLLLGSVSQTLIHHADCPVAVIRPASTT
jgi:nucleotide-binding universal stress UspA family protein